jgi:hypothetical protein
MMDWLQEFNVQIRKTNVKCSSDFIPALHWKAKIAMKRKDIMIDSLRPKVGCEKWSIKLVAKYKDVLMSSLDSRSMFIVIPKVIVHDATQAK